MTPRVSVLMCVHNGERYLREAVESILNQTFADFEFIIIDDGSTDGTWGILSSYADPRIRLGRNEANLGLTCSLNKGLALARGEYIARMDADDGSLPERLAMQVDFLEAHSEVGVLGSAVRIIDGCGKSSAVWQLPTEHALIRWCLCFDNAIAHPTVMMRRDVVCMVGGYDTSLATAQDYDLWRRLSCVTRLANLPDVLLHLRRHGSSVGSVHFKEQRQNAVDISRRMMSGILGEDVPWDIVYALHTRQFATSGDAYLAAKLIFRLWRAVQADGALSRIEKRLIREDAANRLFRLASTQVGNVHLWPIVALLCRLNPLMTLKRGAAKGVRMLRGATDS